jgi:hypothetical protein
MKNLLIPIIILIIIGAIFFFMRNNQTENIPASNDTEPTVSRTDIDSKNEGYTGNDVLADFSQPNSDPEFAFASDNLKTDTAIRSIDLSEVLGGGPAKDGIPAINDPKFYSIDEAYKVENAAVTGIAIEINGEAKFYPYSILTWHEIVNDSVGGQNVTVTFCPLCGTGIVFDPNVNGNDRLFGVSGKLWQSNLLMYDDKNESLWSQSLGEAVVGVDTGTVLNLIDSDLITLDAFAKRFPNGKVLTRETGHIRSYGTNPYSGYADDDKVLFPVKFQNSALPSKEIMYVFRLGDKSVALKRNDAIAEDTFQIEVDGQFLSVLATDRDITVIDPDDKKIPGFVEMWFSFATQHPENGIYWTKEAGVVE